jgi:hypothetical protein
MATKLLQCPACPAKYPNTKMGRIQLASHSAKMQKQGELDPREFRGPYYGHAYRAPGDGK